MTLKAESLVLSTLSASGKSKHPPELMSAIMARNPLISEAEINYAIWVLIASPKIVLMDDGQVQKLKVRQRD